MKGPKGRGRATKESILREKNIRWTLEKLPFMKGRVDAHVIEVARGAMAVLVLRGIGVAVSTAVCMVVTRWIGVYFVRKHLGIWTIPGMGKIKNAIWI